MHQTCACCSTPRPQALRGAVPARNPRAQRGLGGAHARRAAAPRRGARRARGAGGGGGAAGGGARIAVGRGGGGRCSDMGQGERFR